MAATEAPICCGIKRSTCSSASDAASRPTPSAVALPIAAIGTCQLNARSKLAAPCSALIATCMIFTAAKMPTSCSFIQSDMNKCGGSVWPEKDRTR